jgi:hypothetical protein
MNFRMVSSSIQVFLPKSAGDHEEVDWLGVRQRRVGCEG